MYLLSFVEHIYKIVLMQRDLISNAAKQASFYAILQASVMQMMISSSSISE